MWFIIIMKLWPASEPWSWYMYENGRELFPGERAQHARQRDLEAAEAELAAATRADGVVATAPAEGEDAGRRRRAASNVGSAVGS